MLIGFLLSIISIYNAAGNFSGRVYDGGMPIPSSIFSSPAQLREWLSLARRAHPVCCKGGWCRLPDGSLKPIGCRSPACAYCSIIRGKKLARAFEAIPGRLAMVTLTFRDLPDSEDLPRIWNAFTSRLRRSQNPYAWTKGRAWMRVLEFGELRGRPHYHVLDRVPVLDLDPVCLARLYTQSWGLGRVQVDGPCESDVVVAYLAGYTSAFEKKRGGYISTSRGLTPARRLVDNLPRGTPVERLSAAETPTEYLAVTAAQRKFQRRFPRAVKAGEDIAPLLRELLLQGSLLHDRVL